MLFLLICRFLRLLPPVTQSNLRRRRLFSPGDRILSAFLIRVPHLLVGVGVPVWLFVLLGSVPLLVECLSPYL